MSKKIWRVRVDDKTGEVWCDESRGSYNTTMIDDSACFPVKEAMSLCKAACEFSERSQNRQCLYPGYGGLWDAVAAYQKAVERMKKKASKK